MSTFYWLGYFRVKTLPCHTFLVFFYNWEDMHCLCMLKRSLWHSDMDDWFIFRSSPLRPDHPTALPVWEPSQFSIIFQSQIVPLHLLLHFLCHLVKNYQIMHQSPEYTNDADSSAESQLHGVVVSQIRKSAVLKNCDALLRWWLFDVLRQLLCGRKQTVLKSIIAKTNFYDKVRKHQVCQVQKVTVIFSTSNIV